MWIVTSVTLLKAPAPWKKSYDKPSQHIKEQRQPFADKGPYSQSYGVSSSYLWMWELDHKEGWKLKKWCFWTVILKKTLESLLDSKKIKPVDLKWNQPWIFISRTDAEAAAPIIRPQNAKNWLIWKEHDAGKDWKQKEKGMTEDEMVGWHHWPNEHEFEQIPGDTERQGSLACCHSWGCKSWTWFNDCTAATMWKKALWGIPKTMSKWIIDLNVKLKIIKLLEENRTFFNLLGKEF